MRPNDQTQHTRAADLPRFVDVGGGGSRYARAALDVVIGFAVGMGVVAGVALITGIVGEEAFGRLNDAIEYDLFVRAGFGAASIVAAAVGVALPVLYAVDRALFFRRLEAVVRRDRAAVPSARARARVATAPARTLSRLVRAWGVIALVVAAMLVAMLATVEDVRGNPEPWIGLVVCAVVIVAWVVLGPLLGVAADRWQSRAQPLVADWAARHAFVAQSEQRRRMASVKDDGPAILAPRVTWPLTWATGATGAALGLAVVVWFGSVAMRQPCRSCDKRYYDEPGERFIDWLSATSGVVMAVLAGLLVALLVVNLVVLRVREVAAARWIADGQPRRTRGDRIERFLIGPRAARLLAQGLVAAVAPVAVVVAFADVWFDVYWADAAIALPIAAAAFVVAMLIAASDDGAAERECTALRAVLSPGDPTPKTVAARVTAQRTARKASTRA
ncbi:hypothetical protein ASE14_15160 [Agromyces sp. Root81]|uniref:hypothetical protein n=1 Tax=Agromyces sp. Root81 TaxID=1736601 RepID=UPI0006FDE6DC|nr:hypothetical protein [Agromyces sp. Root81]KRC59118.1 hypothetical protein ASE14_15160 [Agromyces sp. Root81]